MVEISIIYYVYDNQIFLKDSLDSIITQTFEDFELICIDDASTDDSLTILEEYKEKDERIIIKTSSEHKGMAQSLNDILKQVNGKYDYITNASCVLNYDALELLYKKAEENECDLTASDMGYLNEITDVYYEKKCFIDLFEETFNYNDIPNLIDIDVSTENKLFLDKFIRDNDLEFINDEKSFVYESVFKANQIAYIPFVLCIHNDYCTSLVNRNDSQLLNLIPFSNTLMDLFRENDVLENNKRRIYDHKMYITVEGLNKIQEKYKEEYFDNLRNDLKKILLNDEFNKDFLENISEYYRKIFEMIIISESYYEFELLKKTYYEMNDYYHTLVDKNIYKKAKEDKNNQ